MTHSTKFFMKDVQPTKPIRRIWLDAIKKLEPQNKKYIRMLEITSPRTRDGHVQLKFDKIKTKVVGYEWN